MENNLWCNFVKKEFAKPKELYDRMFFLNNEKSMKRIIMEVRKNQQNK